MKSSPFWVVICISLASASCSLVGLFDVGLTGIFASFNSVGEVHELGSGIDGF